MTRQEIEFLLSTAKRGVPFFGASAEIMVALCQCWLAVQDAPVAEAGWDGGAETILYFEGGPEEMRGCRWNAHMAEKLDGKRVRLVPVEMGDS